MSALASSFTAAVAGQQQYTSRKADTLKRQLTFKNANGVFVDAEKARYKDSDEEVLHTPDLYWDSDGGSDTSSPNLTSVFEDWGDSASSESTSVSIDEDGAQVISISAENTFYHPPPTPRPFGFQPFSDSAFPENFISAGHRDAPIQNIPSESLYEKLERLSPNDAIVIVDAESLLEFEEGIFKQTGKYSLDLPWESREKVSDNPKHLSSAATVL
ncbi:hypothetical protein BDQ12DRAFT_673961 [Crucibulum laeve]|uniref:Uncharacterized protein n=1 Tax=Crucibulum laeve TaxID=68775 RepID=A0A5C3MHW4_9AGAR|nr:hypothetical protein BDQ12DRAFT_673961 [Crucibulum laeve]